MSDQHKLHEAERSTLLARIHELKVDKAALEARITVGRAGPGELKDALDRLQLSP